MKLGSTFSPISTSLPQTLFAWSARLNNSLARFAATDLVFIPQWYGAKGDGVADDTNAVRAAIAACAAAGGGVVFFPRGTYLLNNNGTAMVAFGAVIEVPNGVTVRGAGRGATILKVTANLGEISLSATRFIRLMGDHAAIEDCSVEGNFGTVAVHPRAGIAIEGASHCAVRNVHSHNFRMHALIISSTDIAHPTLDQGVGSNYNTVESCLLEGGEGSTTIIYSTPTAGVKNIGNKFVNVTSRAKSEYTSQFFSLECRFSDYNQFVNCDFLDSNLASRAGINVEQSSSDNTWTNCRIQGNYNGVYLFGVSGRVKRNRFISCDILDGVGSGVLMHNADDTKFIGGSISRNAGRGVYDLPLATNSTMSLELGAGHDTGWVIGQTVTSSGGGSATIALYLDGVLYVTGHSDFAGIAIGNTLTQGANTGVVALRSTDASTGTRYLDLEVEDNGAFGLQLGAGRSTVLGCKFRRNVDRSITLHDDASGVVDYCDFETDFVSATPACGDIWADDWQTSKMLLGANNKLSISRIYQRRTASPINYTSALDAPQWPESTVLAETVVEDADSISHDKRVRAMDFVSAACMHIPLHNFVGYPATNVLIYVRLKDDGSARAMVYFNGSTSPTFNTNGMGTWAWYTLTIPVANLTATTRVSLAKQAASGTVYFDGYVIKDS